MPLEKIIPGAPPQTIDEVIQALEQLIAECADSNDRIGYFAALYHKVTVRVKQGILNREFENGARMERLDVIFANRYLKAVEQYRNQETPTGSWQAAFDAARKRSTLVLQHLLLGMNAHINLDLGIAAVEAANRNDLRSIRNDITNARDGAWSFAEDLDGKIGQPLPAWNTCINNRDGIIKKLGLSLLKPKGLIRITMWIIHLFEWKKPARVIRAFYKYEKKYISFSGTSTQPHKSQAAYVASKEL